VKSKDAADNLRTSPDYTFTTTAAPDTTPPAISNVASSSVTSSSVTITWTTNEGSDSQVEYGTTTAYGSTTTLNASMVTSHSQSLSGLTANTPYHYRVKSSDSAGNPGLSGDYMFTTSPMSDNTPPVITSVLVTNVTSTGATITWKTDKPSDTKVEYGKTTSYSNAAAAAGTTTNHSLKLRKLNPRTQYHFRAISADGDGLQAASEDMVFSTLAKGTTQKTLVIPLDSIRLPGRASATSSNDSEESASIDDYLGFALTNMDTNPATLIFTAIDDDGNIITGSDIVNPVYDELAPGEQMGVLDFEVFGNGLAASTSVGYIKVESTTTKIAGLYTIFDSDQDSNLTMLDGTNLAAEPMTTLIFPEVEGGNYTKVNISNSNDENVNVMLELVGADGMVHSMVQKTIEANGALVADLFGEIFTGMKPAHTQYVRVRGTRGVQGFELLRKSTGDVAALVGQDANGGAVKLYSPQFAMGGIYRSSVSIINLDSVGGIATVRFIGQNATQIGTTKVITLAPNGKAYVDDPDFFQELNLDDFTQGYLEIASYGLRLTGSVVFGESSGNTLSTALPLVSKLENSILFSHVASNDIYFTGYAIVNPNSTTATANLELHAADGSVVETTVLEIPAYHRETRLLTEYFPTAKGLDIRSGYVRITVDVPVAAYSIYGTSNFSVISAVPTQGIQ